MRKRILAVLIMAALLLTSIGYPVKAEEDERNGEEVTADMEVTAIDSFGTMTADLINGEIEDQDENGGCNIFSIEVNGTQAVVDFQTNQYASLIVAVYDESGDQMIASGNVDVVPGEEEAVVEIETDYMPEYFYLRGFLADYETFESYCTAYESPVYTQEMQEFLSKTPDDFQGQEILNLDSDASNNFAVYNDETVVVDETSGENVIAEADEENQIYVIENVDSTISSLKPGAILSYEYADGSVLIVKVASIVMDGTTARITGEETSLEEVFDYVKIDAEQYAGEAQIDDSTCDDGVIYEGMEENAGRARAVDLELEDSASVSFTLDKQMEDDFKLSGGLKLKVSNTLKIYLSISYQYVELSINYSAEMNASFSGKCEVLSLELTNIAFMPVAGVIVEFTPSLILETSGKVDVSGVLAGRVGFCASGDEGIKNLTKNPSFDTELKGELTLFVGLSLKPKVKILSDNVAKLEVGAEVGAEVKGEQSVQNTGTGETLHECTDCLDGEINAKCELSFGANLIKIFSFELKKDFSVKMCDFYWSADFNEFGFTVCPHYSYLVKVTVVDGNKQPVSGAVVNEEYITDQNGRTRLYLSGGEHILKVKKDRLGKSKKIAVKDMPKDIAVKFVGFAGGDGTEENPYQIETAMQLDSIRENEEAAAYILVNDIDLSGYDNWSVIGNDEKPFAGIFDGNNHVITNLTITETDSIYVGLFGVLCSYDYNNSYKNSTIKNLNVTNVNIRLAGYHHLIVGTIACVDGVIENCYAEGRIEIRDYISLDVGGIASSGYENNYCINDVDIFIENPRADERNYHGTIYCGGITASTSDSITNCINYGDINIISGNFLYVGGISGRAYTISYCANYGNINGRTDYYELYSSSYYNCHSGGIIGIDGSSVTNCVNFGNITGDAVDGTSHAGGISGGVTARINNCYNMAEFINSNVDNYEGLAQPVRIGYVKYELTECYSLDTTLLNGQVSTEYNSSDDINGASMDYETLSKLVYDRLGFESPDMFASEGTSGKSRIIEQEQDSVAYTSVEDEGDTYLIPENGVAVAVRENENGTITVQAAGLEKGEIYNLYSMKKLNGADPFNAETLLYIDQLTADENGTIKRTFMPRESCKSAITFVVKMADTKDSGGAVGPVYIKGDVTDDGRVTIDDLRLILRSVCRKVTLTEIQIMAADVEENGTVDIADLRKVLRYVCGKIDEL